MDEWKDDTSVEDRGREDKLKLFLGAWLLDVQERITNIDKNLNIGNPPVLIYESPRA